MIFRRASAARADDVLREESRPYGGFQAWRLRCRQFRIVARSRMALSYGGAIPGAASF